MLPKPSPGLGSGFAGKVLVLSLAARPWRASLGHGLGLAAEYVVSVFAMILVLQQDQDRLCSSLVIL